MAYGDETFDRLAELFPKCFFQKGHERRPLKLGIGKELAAMNLGIAPVRLDQALTRYVRSRGYLWNASIPGTPRIGLDGEVAGAVSESEAKHAKAAVAGSMKRREATAHNGNGNGKAAPLAYGSHAQPAARQDPAPKALDQSGRLTLAGLRAAAAARKALHG